MYIAQAYKSLHDGWRYVLGVLVSFIIGSQIIGIIPLMIAMVSKSMEDGKMPNLTDMSSIFTMFESNLTLFLMLFPFVVGLLLLLFWNKLIHKSNIKLLTTSRSKIDWKRVFFAFGLWAVVTIVMTVVDYQLNPEGYEWNFDTEKFAILAVIAIIMVPLQTSYEEYLFRGYLMQGIGINSSKKYFAYIFITITLSILILTLVCISYNTLITLLVGIGLFLLFLGLFNNLNSKSYFESNSYSKIRKVLNSFFTPLFITSVIFGLLHIANPEVEKIGYIIMVYYIGTGFFLGIMTLMDEGLELALGFHAANNLITALLVTANWTAFQTNSVLKDMSEPAAGVDVLIPVFVVFPILLFIFAKKYKWTNWNDKLFGKVEDPSILKVVDIGVE